MISLIKTILVIAFLFFLAFGSLDKRGRTILWRTLKFSRNEFLRGYRRTRSFFLCGFMPLFLLGCPMTRVKPEPGQAVNPSAIYLESHPNEQKAD